MKETHMRVEVVYALATAQDCVALEVQEGALAYQAVKESGLIERHPELSAEVWRLGIFGQEVAPERPLRDGDRIEILRPLAMDPKEARRRRARRTRV